MSDPDWRREEREQEAAKRRKIIALTAGGVAVFVALILIAMFLLPVYNRYQHRQDASNKVQVVRIEIEKAEEEAKVNRAQIKATEAEAEKRVAESVGIKEAQVEINKTLTPLYVEHEFVQAIERGHVEVSMIPVGPNGLPLVDDVSPLHPALSGE